MRTNELGLELIHLSEGLASVVPNTDARVKGKYPKIASKSQLQNPNLILYPYYDIVGVKTIGYGHTLTFISDPNAFKNGVTKKFCDELFGRELLKYENGVKKYITSDINENQFSALVSFAYNCGIGSLQISNLRKVINKDPEDFTSVKREFLKWNKAKGMIVPALTTRRTLEYNLFETPVEKKISCDIDDPDSTLIV